MTPYYNVYESGIITTMTSIKHFSIAFGALALMLLVSFLIVNNSTQFRSVEFGLVELSPRGVEGGYAMPASGASAPTGLQYSCSSSGTSVNLSWGGSSYQGALPSDEKLAKAGRPGYLKHLQLLWLTLEVEMEVEAEVVITEGEAILRPHLLIGGLHHTVILYQRQ